MSKIGILGGTFDPIHHGHLIITTYAAHDLGLDRVLIMPAQTPPHKLGRTISVAEDRVEMIRLGIENDPLLQLSTADLRSDAPSYTATLLERLEAEYPGDELYFIIGADSLRALPTWHRPDLVIRRARLAVARRPGIIIDDTILDALPGLRARTSIFTSPLIDISSTAIRERVVDDKPITWLVPPAVEHYILEHDLYT